MSHSSTISFVLLLLLRSMQQEQSNLSTGQDIVSVNYSHQIEHSVSQNYVAVVDNMSQAFQWEGVIPLSHQKTIVVDVHSLDSLYNGFRLIHSANAHHSWMPFILFKISRSSGLLEKDVLDKLRMIDFGFFSRIDLRSCVFITFNEGSLQTAYEIYLLRDQLFLKQVSLLIKNSDNVLTIQVEDSLVSRRKNFHGSLVNGVTQDDTNLELIARFENDPQPKFKDGVSVTYFQLMAFGLNFSMGAIRGIGWISQAPNGSLLGMAEQLVSGEADLLIAHSELLAYRLRGLRFVHPYYRGRVRAFFKQPVPNTIRNIFIHPLQMELWLSLGILWAFLVISMKIAHKVKVRCGRISSMPFEGCTDKSLKEQGVYTQDQVIAGDAFLWAISTACGQGWHMLPQSGSMKLIMLSGLTTFIFSYTAYSAAIVTSLSVFLIPIKTWSELLNSGYKIYGDTLLQSSAVINNKPLGRSPFSQETIGVADALKMFSENEPIAIISVFDQFYQIASKFNVSPEFLCKTVAKVSVDGNGTATVVKGGMLVPENSPYRKFFNYQTVLIQERGLDARLSRHYSNQLSPGCLRKTSFSLHSYTLEINDVFTPFAILLSGCVFSVFIVIVELATSPKLSSYKELDFRCTKRVICTYHLRITISLLCQSCRRFVYYLHINYLATIWYKVCQLTRTR